MGPGGVAHQVDAARVAAEAGGVVVCPADGQRPVFDERGERDMRVQPVVRQHRHEAARRQGLGDEAVIALAAGLPVAAVEEDDDRARRSPSHGPRGPGGPGGPGDRVGRPVDVQLLAGEAAVGEVGRADVPAGGHGGVEQVELGAAGGGRSSEVARQRRSSGRKRESRSQEEFRFIHGTIHKSVGARRADRSRDPDGSARHQDLGIHLAVCGRVHSNASPEADGGERVWPRKQTRR